MNFVPMKILFFFPLKEKLEILENDDLALFINLKEHCVRMGNEYFK